MGISANQARLMTLTARQHDLELRAQSISAAKMVTSMNSQSSATAYSTALNNYSIAKQIEAIDSNERTAEQSAKLAAILGSNSDAEQLLNSAKGTYDTKVASLSAEEKLFDMELTQINTEHNAIKTEYDAIKSLIGDNVEKSFNVFG